MASNNKDQQTTPTVEELQAQLAEANARADSAEKALKSESARADSAEKALKDAEQATEKNAVAQNPAEPEMYTIELYKDKNITEDVQVLINGQQYIIQRGVRVQVPKAVYRVLQNQKRMMATIAAFNEQNVKE